MPEQAEIFDAILTNLKVGNADTVRDRRDEITRALNREFRETDSMTHDRLMVGSWGRKTSINGFSDLDMIYILPKSLSERFHAADGPRKALSRTRDAIKERYPRTNVRMDRLVVVVQFSDYVFEVQPCFELGDGAFEYPDTKSGTWKRTDPRSEISAMTALNKDSHGNARKLCRLARAWNRKQDVGMGGLLLDTMVWRFLQEDPTYMKSSIQPENMMRDFFLFLSDRPRQESWNALGSNQRVKVKKNFQTKAGKAANLCVEAIEASSTAAALEKWRKVFGRFVPKDLETKTISDIEPWVDTEEFIEDFYPVNLRYDLTIDCDVTQNGFQSTLLSHIVRDKLWLSPFKKLRFRIVQTDTPEPYQVLWKVLNCGPEAERRNLIRGQIIEPSNARTGDRIEETHFRGVHHVECYLIRNREVVARSEIDVPIREL